MDALDSQQRVNSTAPFNLLHAAEIQATSSSLFVTAVLGLFLVITVARIYHFALNGWAARSVFAKLRSEGRPMPPWNPALGHLLSAKAALDGMPPGAHSSYVIDRLIKQYGSKGAFYFDTWPVTRPMIIVADPKMASQAISHSYTGAEKPHTLLDWFRPISGGHNLFTQNGLEWKRDHNMFLPAFSNSNLDAAMPVVIEQLLIYRDKLRVKATTGELFNLEPLTQACMNDIIGNIVFNAELGAQSKSHPLADRMIRQLQTKFGSYNVMESLFRLSPFNWFNIWNNNRLLNLHIKAQVLRRVRAHQSSKAREDQADFKSILDVALEWYFSQPGMDASSKVDSRFLEKLYAQMRMFFFAGYDSTAATMVYCCYTAWKYPEVLAKLRAEHDKVFGRNVAACADIIAANPAILNSLPYTNAVIKETMRLYPPANGTREGCPDLVLKAEDGTEFPTEHCALQFNHITIHHDPKYWPRPSEFIPERWLVEPGHELYPPKGAWRVFEWGVRNCTGQALVMKEVKAFLAILAREFDLQECYDEIDGDTKRDVSLVYEEKIYLTEAGAAHPRDRFPCRLSLSKCVL